MAKTTFETNNALTKKAWEEKLFRDSRKDVYFEKFTGTSSESIVQRKEQLTKSKGDKITFGIRMRLAGAGVSGDAILENNEEALSTYDFSVTLDQQRHAVRDNGALTRKRVMFNIDEESKDALKVWGSEKRDLMHFDALGLLSTSSVTPSKVFYKPSGGVLTANSAATAKSNLHATDSKLTPNMISGIKAWAISGGNRQYVPLRPVKVGGKSYYVLLVHPDVMYDLKIDSTFAQARREAMERGSENPIFTGATAVWDGVVIHEHENCAIGTDGGGGSVAWSKAALLGAQSLVVAEGERGEVVQETFDYKNQNGYAWKQILAVGKPVFNSLDYGSLGVYLSRTNISGL
jgi:N4-gp56 family major capsid protein